MAYQNYFLIFLIAVLGSNFIECANFIPVLKWSRNKVSESVPALHKISQESYKDTLLEYLERDPYVIVFTEPTLSPEDFAQRDQNGETAFPNLQQLKNSGNYVSYRPYVQNPVGAVKQVNKPVTQISIGSILSSSNVPKDHILIINLDDAKDGETRFHMLKRHDFDIVSIYEDFVKQHDNVLALYTGNHTAWVTPDDVTRVRSRNLLQSTDAPPTAPGNVYRSENVLLYLTSDGTFMSKGSDGTQNQKSITGNFTLTPGANNTNFNTTLGGDDLKIQFDVTVKAGYWYINQISVQEGTGAAVPLVKFGDIYAPTKFSYHCATFNFTNKERTISLALPGFQFQPFGKIDGGFGDAYDCTGFTSVPIWSGIFVTAILLSIITFGLTMMMDIRTMDRFDDPKGKTITVNASE